MLPRQNERRRITDADASAAHDGGVQRQIAAKAPADIPQHLGIAMQCVGIDGRHRAAAAQRVEPHDDVAYEQFRTRPRAFSEPLRTADENVFGRSIQPWKGILIRVAASA